jgi:hypothetical protein
MTVEGKSSEIPAMRGLLDIKGCMIVADALHCRKETAKAVIEGKGDCLLNVKDNRRTLKEETAGYVQEEGLRKGMDSHTTCGKTGGRVERRTAYTGKDIGWLYGKEGWERLACIGAVNPRFTGKKGTSDERHSSRSLKAEELLRLARLEWAGAHK